MPVIDRFSDHCCAKLSVCNSNVKIRWKWVNADSGRCRESEGRALHQTTVARMEEWKLYRPSSRSLESFDR